MAKLTSSQAAASRGERVNAAAAVVMPVFRDVREMREIAERAHDLERLRDRQRIQQTGERAPMGIRVGAGRAPEADCRLPYGLDPLEARDAELRAQHVAQHAAEQPRVFLDRQILVDGVRSVQCSRAVGRCN